MKLTELKPRFVRFEAKYEIFCEFNVAQGVLYLCPKCFSDNKGPVGTHSVVVPFSGRGLTDDLNPIRNSDGKPVYWEVSGTGYEDLTTKPSIQLIGGCAWHGFITNGNVT